MKTSTLKRRRTPTDAEATAETGSVESLTPDIEWTAPAAWITKATSFLLMACVIAGPVALVLTFWQSGSSAPVSLAPSGPEAAAPDEVMEVSAFAEDFVSTWLSTAQGHEDRLEPFLASGGGVTVPERPWHAEEFATAGIEQLSDGAWSVVVAATVSESPRDAGMRRYFQIPVHRTLEGLVAQTLPAPVNGPGTTPPPELEYPGRADLSAPPARAAGEFLVAYLTGVGDLARLITPGSELVPVSPPLFATVAVEEVLVDQELTDVEVEAPADGQQLRLLVTAAAAPVQERQALAVQYAVTVTARDTRWEVDSIDLSPATASPDLSTDPEPGTSSSSSSDPTDVSSTTATETQ